MNTREQYKAVYSAYRACVNAQFSLYIGGSPSESDCADMWQLFSDLCAGMPDFVVNAAKTSYLNSLNSYTIPTNLIRTQMFRKREYDQFLEELA